MICDPFDIVVVPFPFVDSGLTLRRPALVVSARDFNKMGRSILAMITTAEHASWPGDVPIDWKQSGLPRPGIVRMKMFTLDNRPVERKAGSLSGADRKQVVARMWQILPHG